MGTLQASDHPLRFSAGPVRAELERPQSRLLVFARPSVKIEPPLPVLRTPGAEFVAGPGGNAETTAGSSLRK